MTNPNRFDSVVDDDLLRRFRSAAPRACEDVEDRRLREVLVGQLCTAEIVLATRPAAAAPKRRSGDGARAFFAEGEDPFRVPPPTAETLRVLLGCAPLWGRLDRERGLLKLWNASAYAAPRKAEEEPCPRACGIISSAIAVARTESALKDVEGAAVYRTLMTRGKYRAGQPWTTFDRENPGKIALSTAYPSAPSRETVRAAPTASVRAACYGLDSDERWRAVSVPWADKLPAGVLESLGGAFERLDGYVTLADRGVIVVVMCVRP